MDASCAIIIPTITCLAGPCLSSHGAETAATQKLVLLQVLNHGGFFFWHSCWQHSYVNEDDTKIARCVDTWSFCWLLKNSIFATSFFIVFGNPFGSSYVADILTIYCICFICTPASHHGMMHRLPDCDASLRCLLSHLTNSDFDSTFCELFTSLKMSIDPCNVSHRQSPCGKPS